MSAEIWPASLPKGLLIDGAVDSVPDGRIRTQTDTGPGKSRLRNPAAVRRLTGDMILSETQLNTMRTFVTTTIMQGTLPFHFYDPINAADILVQFGSTLPTWIALSADKYKVSLNLEVLA